MSERKHDSVLSVTIICLVLGAMLALQFRTQLQMGDVSGYRRADALAQMLANTRSQADQQREEITTLRAELGKYQASVMDKDKLMGLVNERLASDQIALGLVDVKGPGVAISIADSSLRADAPGAEELFLVHDSDLWPVVNELRSAGAEAISINGQRVVGSTAIRCAGPVINVNSVPIDPPFEILAIGNPDTLYNALTITQGVMDRFKNLKFPVNIIKEQDIVIKAVGVEPKFKYARPIRPETGPPPPVKP